MQVAYPGSTQSVGQNQAGGGRVDQAIRTGAAATGVSFDYLARTAYRESSYRTDLTMSTSSATGLYQFLDQTWLGLVKTEGPGVGLGAASAAITRDRNGRYDVADPQMKQRILDLRRDPTVSAVMAGKFTQQNQSYMTGQLGRAPTSGELYAGHVLGPAGGAKLIQLAQTAPNAAAADYYPEAAASNRAIFYQPNGQPKSIADVYGYLTREVEVPPPSGGQTLAPGMVATAPRPSPAGVNPLSTIIAAQTAGSAKEQPLAFATGNPAEARRSLESSVAQLSIPGEAGKAQSETGSTLAGWRAKRSNDAFSALMRSDAAEVNDELPMDLVALGRSGKAQAVSKLLPGLGGPGLGGPAAGVSAFAPLGRSGGAGAAEAMASGTAGAGGVTGDGQRHSRIYTDALRRAGGGAPAQPLPMVTGPLGVMRPSRFSATAYAAGGASAGATAGSVAAPGGLPLGALSFAPVEAAPSAPAAASTASTAGVPILPPVPAEAWSVSPLDLVAESRGRVL